MEVLRLHVSFAFLAFVFTVNGHQTTSQPKIRDAHGLYRDQEEKGCDKGGSCIDTVQGRKCKGSSQEHKCNGPSQEHKCKCAPSQEYKCKGPSQEHKCNGPSQEHKCKEPSQEHKCKGPSQEHKCKGSSHEHKCKGPAQEHKCKGPSQEHKCKGSSQEHKCKCAPSQEHKCKGPSQEHKCKGPSQEHKCKGPSQEHKCKGLTQEYKCKRPSQEHKCNIPKKYCDCVVNECDKNPCRHNGTCIHLGDGYSCKCPAGVSGRHCEADIDECNLSNYDPCQNGATCVNTLGSYKCNCASGFFGKHCEQDKNECESSPCLNGATCINLEGRYECLCPYDYTGVNCDKACRSPLGMESGLIKDAQITASSEYNVNHAAIQGRLNFKPGGGKTGAWSAQTNNLNQWIQVDLRTFAKVTGFSTQGRNGVYNQWVTNYKLEYSDDGVTFRFYHEPGQSLAKVFDGNQDRDTIVYHQLKPPIEARYIRLRPTKWHGHISMRMELYGCED